MTKTIRRLLRYSLVVVLLVALTGLPAGAAGSWVTFSVKDGCGSPISVDGNNLAMADGVEPRHLYYGKTNKTKLTDTGIADVGAVSIKGENIVFSGMGPISGAYFVYNIRKAELTQTALNTSLTSPNGRFFNGTYIAYIDSVDRRLKLYSIQDNQVTDTGVYLGYFGRDLTIDGNIVALQNAGQVGYYDIATGVMTYFDSTSYYGFYAPVVTGNLISYIGGDTELKYYTINDGQVHGAGIMGIRMHANDGSRIAYQQSPGGPVKIFDPATGGSQDTGQYVCDSGGCWLEFSGGKLYSELHEGGTRDEFGNLVYPPADYNGDGQSTVGACVHAMTTVEY